MSGVAKLFVDYACKASNYRDLSKALKHEFGQDVNQALIIKQLIERKKKGDESYREYIYKMIKLAEPAELSVAAVIIYIVDGIQGSPQSKSFLYEAKDYSDLKSKLIVYDLIQSKIKSERKPEDNKKDKIDYKSENKNKFSKKKRCHNCGDQEHEEAVCPNKDKGPKCFKCNEFGHRAPGCSKLKNQKNSAKINIIKNSNLNKEIEINNVVMNALIDTGSEITVIREDVFNRYNLGTHDAVPTTIKGIGSIIKTTGKFEATIRMDNCELKVEFAILSKQFMSVEMIMGMNFLAPFDLCVTQDGVHITKRNNNNNVIENEIASLSNCLYVSQEEQIMPDLSHIADKTISTEIKQLINQYEPKPINESPVQLKIVLTDEVPVYQSPRRLPQIEKDEVDKQIEEWLRDGIIQPSCSDYASPIVLVKKKDGTKRLCVDYRKLNMKIYKDRYPLPIIEDHIDKLQKGKIFCTLDLANGFFHVPVESSSRKYTAFVTPSGQYEFLRVPFGLCVSPPVFQRYINTIFAPLIAEGIVLIYIDDLIVFAENEQEAMRRLKRVLNCAQQFNLKIKWKKCQLMKQQIEFLGYEIQDGRIRPSPNKTKDVNKFPEPRNAKQVQSFLGLAGYFRKFIENFASIAKPLSDLLKKDVRFTFNKEQQIAFHTLKERICERPVLTIFRYGAETELHTDASKWALGAILMQRDFDDGKLHPVQYFSRKTSSDEQKYHSYELEALAVVKAVKKFRVYLLGQPFTVITDCKSLEATLKKKDLPKIERYAVFLSEFDCKIVYRAASRMKHADALSRMHFIQEASVLKNMRIAQQTDEHIKTIIDLLKEGQHENFVMHNGLLCKEINGDNVIVVPDGMQQNIIQKVHEQAHFKLQKMEDILKKDFYIPHMKNKILNAIQNCVVCILAEKKSGKKEGF